MSTLKELREKLAAKQDAMAKVIEEAKREDGELDFSQVKCLGDDLKTTMDRVQRFREMDAELNDIGEQVEALIAAQTAAHNHAEREKAVNRPPHPQAGKGDDRQAAQSQKSLGEMVCGHKGFQSWQAKGANGGITIQLDDVLPSDILAKGVVPETIGQKALFQTTAGWAPESIRIPQITEAPTRPIQLLDIVPLGRTGMEQVVYMEETTRTHGAAEAAEGATFAESAFELTEQSSPVRKITDSVPVTDEQLEDVAQAESYLNGRLVFGLRQRMDSQILIGDGAAPNLRGLKNTVGIQTQAKGADPVPDAFFKAMTKIRLNGRAIPTHHVIHPTDWEGVRLLRTADGIYIWGNPSEAGPERMWGLPVVQSDADSAGTGYVGSFEPAWVQQVERRGVDIQVGFVGTQFLQGRRTIRGDMRMALVFYRPAAFSTVTGL